jgi:hypothetical protein
MVEQLVVAERVDKHYQTRAKHGQPGHKLPKLLGLKYQLAASVWVRPDRLLVPTPQNQLELLGRGLAQNFGLAQRGLQTVSVGVVAANGGLVMAGGSWVDERREYVGRESTAFCGSWSAQGVQLQRYEHT